MIHFVLGGFGDGKSYSGMRMLRNELLNGSRPVVTNLAVNQKALAAYFGSHFRNCSVRLLQRLRIIDDEEVSQFFAKRVSPGGLFYDIPVPDKEAEKRGARPDWTRLRDHGVLFIIEEAHEFFGAREWQNTGRGVLAYKNQNRKFGDDIILITPELHEIEKAFRTCGQSYTTLTNLGVRKVHGIRLPGVFLAREYTRPPERGAHPINVYRYNLDVDLANCYDTAKGVRGVQGVLADKVKPRRGIPWWLVLGSFVVAACLFFFTPYVLGKEWLFHGFLKPVAKSKAIASQTRQEAFSGQTASVPTRSASVSTSAGVAPLKAALSDDGSNVVGVTGFIVPDPSQIKFFLSDGQTLDSRLDRIQQVTRRFVVANNIVYPMLKGGVDSVNSGSAASVLPATQMLTPSVVSLQAASSVDRGPMQANYGSKNGTVSVTIIGQAYLERKPHAINSGFNSPFSGGSSGGPQAAIGYP